MRSARKWKKDLVSIGFPNCDKLSQDNILDIIYRDVPGRLELLKWIASKVLDEGEDKNNVLAKEDLAKFFCDRNMLQKANADDFINAKPSDQEQKNNWKVLFSLTRMKIYFSNSEKVHFKRKKKAKKLELSDNTAKEKVRSIRESNSDSEDNNFQKDESDKTKKEEKKHLKLKSRKQKDAEYENQPKVRNEKALVCIDVRSAKKPEHSAEYQLDTYSSNFKPLFSTPNMDEFIYEFRSKQGEIYDETSGQYILANENSNQPFPRIFIPPGAPPLGKLEMDPRKYQIKMEKSAPPITLDGEPHCDNSCWSYKIYEVNKGK